MERDEEQTQAKTLPTEERMATLAGATADAMGHKVNGEHETEHGAREFADYRRKRPTPYMEGLRFSASPGDAGDPDQRVLSDEDLEQAKQEGEQQAPTA